MLATFDLSAVRRFTVNLEEQMRRCNNGEGMECARIDEAILCHVKLCEELGQVVNAWARAVFKGQIAFDPQVEVLLKEQMRELTNQVKEIAACGREWNGRCYELQELNALHFHFADLSYLLEHWVTPQLAVSPAPRVRLPEAVKAQALERLARLPAAPIENKTD
jgi:hypothetical protein